MTPQQTKLTMAAAAIVVILAGSFALNRVASDKSKGDGADGNELTDVDIRRDRLGLSAGKGSGAAGDSNADISKIKGKNGKSGSGFGDDSDLASIFDASTTEVAPIETEAETRERERYEEAQRNKFKYRENDPDKIKPTELSPALQDVTEKYEIPDNMLAALMFVETGGTHRDGDHSMEAGYGVMNLRESNVVDTLAEGASLIGKTKDEVLYDQKANIEAAGALVKSYYEDALASGLSDSEAWYSAVSQYSGRSDPELAAALADETAGWMMKGFELHLDDGGGDLIVPPNSNPPFLPKNYDLVGMTPPTNGSGPQVNPDTIPPDAQSYTGPVDGGTKVAP